MVNTGKPSRGCKTCRARRIKCDETKPVCLKCLKAKKECLGYRDPSDENIRDETQATIRKYKKTRTVVEKEQVLYETGGRDENVYGHGCVLQDSAWILEDIRLEDAEDKVQADVEFWTREYSEPASKTPLSATSSSPSSSESTNVTSASSVLLTPLSTPVEQQAACHLLADYILISDSPGGKRGHYKFLYKILTRPTGPAKCLLYAFKALAFVALSSRPGASPLLVQAESYYAKALREVNRAIQDPLQVKSDNTLGAVLLLAFYETLASARDRLDEYMSHIKGAAHLVKMHGDAINDTDEGAEMYSITRNQIIAFRSMTPSDDAEDYSWLLSQTCPDDYVSRIAKLTISCSEIRMNLDKMLRDGRRHPAKIAAVLNLLRRAQAISAELSNMDQPHNAVWTVHTHSKPGDEAMAPPSGDTYNFHNLYTCGIYYVIWVSHLFLTTCIFRCMAWLVSPDEWRTGEQYELAVEATKRRIGDIVASMPYACSWNGFNSDYGDFAVGMTTPDSPTKGVAGMRGFRPAFTAMMSDYATPEQKEYLNERLRFLADVVGIKQVNVLLKLQHEMAHPSREIERDAANLK